MSDSNVQNCPEPIPYSNESYGYAEIDFKPESHAVFDNQVKLVSVDNILSNQLGNITQPVQQNISGNPNLPAVGDLDVKPLLSSYSGADISSSTTLSNTEINSVSINDIVFQPERRSVPSMSIMEVPTIPLEKQTNENFRPQQPIRNNQPRNNIEKFAPQLPPRNNIEKFGPELPPRNNIEKFGSELPPINNIEKLEPELPETNNNIANFLNQNINLRNNANKNNAVRNNGIKNIEAFSPSNISPSKSKQMMNIKTMDMIVISVVALAAVYYYISTYHPTYISNIDFSKIPILSQLNDANVTKENKIIIIVAIVIGIVLVSRMLK